MFIQMFYSVLLEWLFGDVSHGYYLLCFGQWLCSICRAKRQILCSVPLVFKEFFFPLCACLYGDNGETGETRGARMCSGA